MNWNRLNTVISKRWILLLRYYLPFFKKPEPIYFELRQFIDQKIKAKKNGVSNIILFSEFLRIINDGAISDNLKKLLITSIIPNDFNSFDKKMLKEIFIKFQPDEANPALIIFLNQLSPNIFGNYLQYLCDDLESPQGSSLFYNYEKQIAWCVKLTPKFNIYGKLRLLSLLPDNLIKQNRKSIFTFAAHEIDHVFLCLEKLRPESKKKVLLFYLHYQLNDSDSLFFEFLTQFFILEPQEAYLFFYEYLKQRSIEEQFVIIEKMYDAVSKEKKEMWLAQIVNNYLEIAQAPFINHLLTHVFENKSEVAFLILSIIQKNLKTYSLNFFQILAIHKLLNKPIGQAILEKNCSTSFSDIKFNKQEFSGELQNLVIEHGIKSICPIVSSIINRIPKRSEKLSLHTCWYLFINDNWIDPTKSKLQQWEIIMAKIPDDGSIPEADKATLNFFERLYSLLDPEIVRLKQIEKARYDKEAISEEIKQEERRELTKRIALGEITSISEERMEEVFGKKAEEQKKFFNENFGTHFFSAVTDKHASDAAIREWRLTKNLSFN